VSGKPWEIVVGEARRVLREMEAESFDAAFADPPYGLRFMLAKWDYDVPSVNVFVEVLRVLRPGAYVMFFGGTRTFHRMVCNIEDAGFLPCDLCMWLYGSGFPKSHNISKAIDKKFGAKRRVVGTKRGTHSANGSGLGGVEAGVKQKQVDVPITMPATTEVLRWSGYGTALKPAWEPISLCCKPYSGNIVDGALEHGVGGLGIDASRVGTTGGTAGHDYAKTGLFGMGGKAIIEELNTGRWPANVVLQHSPGCVQRGTREVGQKVVQTNRRGRGGLFSPSADGIPCGPQYGKETIEAWECESDCPVLILDRQSGKTKSPSASYVAHRKTLKTGVDIASRAPTTLIQGHGDEGGASRFFYTSKVSREERDRGLHDFETVAKGADTLRDGSRQGLAKNGHSTLKPIDLCRYYARMLLPPPRKDGKPRRLLVPYSGAGSEMIGALQAGWDEVVGIELVPKHAEWARARIAKGKIFQNEKKR
jgi:site-specific DNA-methyltransferase (adenine-specific)